MDARMDCRDSWTAQDLLSLLWAGSEDILNRRSEVTTSIDVTVNDSKYRAEFKAGTYQMSEAEFISLRRAEDGLEPFIPDRPPQAPTDLAMNPLASGL